MEIKQDYYLNKLIEVKEDEYIDQAVTSECHITKENYIK